MTTRITMTDLAVQSLGPCRIESPLKRLIENRKTNVHYVEEDDRVLFPDTASLLAAAGVGLENLPGFEPAGPRRHIFFDPSKLRAGIVTCGGLCPGINNVIRGLVMELSFHYGVQRIVGFRHGYQGFVPRTATTWSTSRRRSSAGSTRKGGRFWARHGEVRIPARSSTASNG